MCVDCGRCHIYIHTLDIIPSRGVIMTNCVVWTFQAFTAGYSLYVLDVEAGGVAERVGPEGSRDLEQVGVPDWVYEGVCACACVCLWCCMHG